jgi:hypothetical protein
MRLCAAPEDIGRGGNMKQIRKFHESLSSIGVSLEAMIGSLITIGVAAIVLRIATGKW